MDDDISSSRVPLLTAIGWVAGLGWIAGALAWGWMLNLDSEQARRIANLETGQSTPMALTTRLELARIDGEIDRIEAEISRLRAQLEELQHGKRSR